MFQTFDSESDATLAAGRIERLRRWLAEQALDGFLVPRADEHQGEYVAPSSERLHWLTGFSGSAGAALILKDSAHLFVDGRYGLQARQQTDPAIFTIQSLIETPPAEWIRKNLGKGARVGFDPWLHTVSEARKLREAAQAVGADLVALEQNPIDLLWEDRPAPPAAPVLIQPLALAGQPAREKLMRLAETIREAGATHFVLSDPSSVAWAFNIRGGDVAHTPLPLGFAILAAEGLPKLFIDERKLTIEPRAYLTQLANLEPPEALESRLRELTTARAKVGLDPHLSAEKLRLVVEEAGGATISMPDPTRLSRASKNEAEIAGTRAAHRRDGAALARFLCWLDAQQPGSVDEIAAVTALEQFRREMGEAHQSPLKDVSFPTIAGSGPNGAVVHYRVSRGTNRTLGDGELFLVDSGAQYADGTTDVTRTVPVGAPTEEQRERFTLVLKGMIDISMLRFPAGTRGSDIDAVARIALWKAGLDYAHGTGHGVGSFLSVHEGPQRIAKTGTEKLLPGMILSNEPGYYKEGAYGIRIENLILVTPAEPIPDGEIPMHGFETLTLVPIDRRLIRTDFLTEEELRWLDRYHGRVLAEIGPLVEGETLRWLKAACAPLQS
ncbi:MAG TPA: aminopeptidase P family protein [Mesorhizobium sp.]|jgi:Xaa-Pro aminopeptidase|nr:aminopeptidase P family protein [Mesorhizobium sp.]